MVAFVNQKHNTETSLNRHLIPMYQGGPLHKLYFVAIDNQELAIIGLNKKIAATHIVGELEVLN